MPKYSYNTLLTQKRQLLTQQLSETLIEDFCDASGQINWNTLIIYNSGNLT